ncbi:MAG: O-antigen ligase family protein [Parcubacteria group bacterium]|jgi:O-antigen ligase
MELVSKRIAGAIFMGGLVAILFLGFFSSEPLITDSVLTLGLMLFTAFLHRPKWGIFLILFIRPAIDKFSDTFSISFRNININSSAIFGSLVVLLLSLFILKNIAQLKFVPLKKYWLIFLALITLSILFSIDIPASLYEIIRIMSIFLIFVSIFIVVKIEKDYNNLAYSIIYSAIIPFLFATYQLVTGTGLGGTEGIESRLFGTFSHPNPFASFVFIVLVVAIFFFTQEKLPRQKLFLGTMIVWGIFLLIQTYCRGAWLAFLIFLFILTAIKYPKALLGLIFTMLFIFSVSETIQNRVEDIYNPPADSSVRWRFAQWERMSGLFLKKPLTGYGIGTETVAFENEFGYNAGNPYTHNDFLRVALETGILGAIAYFFLIMVTLFKLVVNYRKEKNPWNKDFELFVLALFIAILSFSLTNNTLRETVTQWTMWSLVAVALALHAQKKLAK